MPSPDASRRNARRSTGPRTVAGKLAVRLNGLTHGAFAKDLLLPGEDAKAFRSLSRAMRAELKPSSLREEFLVSRMILASWRLLRLAAMESRVLKSHIGASRNEHLFEKLSWFLFVRSMRSTPPEQETSRIDEPSPDSDWLGRAWLRDASETNAFVKLSRYQNSLERSFYRALHELERLRSEAPQ